MILKRIISLGIVSVLLMTTISVDTSYASSKGYGSNLSKDTTPEAVLDNKSEVVYAKLSAQGNTNAVYVVNHFEVKEAGSITDYGSYESVQNLTDRNLIEQHEDTISLQAQAGDFYYQGNMGTTQLPWTFDISYELDNQRITNPKDLAGKSGNLSITIKTKKNELETKAFFECYMLQISLSLNTEKCSGIVAPEATIAEAGNNKMLTFTVMPNKEAEFKVTTTVNNFSMDGIDIAAMPFLMSLDFPEVNGMLTDLEQLPVAIASLNEGVGKLEDGTTKLKDGAVGLTSGSSDIRNGLSKLSENSSEITTASEQINTALSTIASSMQSGNSSTDFTEILKLPTVLDELSRGLQGISSGLVDLKNGYNSAYLLLDSSIEGIPDTTVTKEQINKQFPDANEKQAVLLEQLYTSYLAGQKVKGTYSQVKQAFAIVVPTIESLSANVDKISNAIDTISDNMESSLSDLDMSSQLEQLTKGLTELANNYAAFDQGLNDYMNGVVQLNTGYQQFDSGLIEFNDGVVKLNDGVTELYHGTTTLNDEVSNMPEMMQSEMNQLMEEYTGAEFEKISFVSSKNTKTELVQFVLKCEGIDLQKDNQTKPSVMEESKKEETIADRFVALFQ